MSSLPSTMQAVIFKAPMEVETETVPVPKIEKPNEVILKVRYAAICGTDLHAYRGHLPAKPGYVLGHEFTGEVVEVGSGITKFKVGDSVVAAFTIQCGECWYCKHGYTSRCPHVQTFGTPGLNGGQANYVKVPYAESTLYHTPKIDGVTDPSIMVLMADIFPTGYYGVSNLVKHVKNEGQQTVDEITVLQLGCGPVGLCAIVAAQYLGIKNYYVFDPVKERRDEAAKYGAKLIPEDQLDDIPGFFKSITDGKGADAVLEAVGAKSSVDLAFKTIRPYGFISSIGFLHDELPFSGLDCYNKNAQMRFGRCPIYTVFREALPVFEKVGHRFNGFVDCKPSLEAGAEYFKKFEKNEVRKVVFLPNGEF